MLSEQARRLVLYILALLVIGWVVRWWRQEPPLPYEEPAMSAEQMELNAQVRKIDPRED